MSLLGVYQVGYVTRDVDQAVALVGLGLTPSDFSRFDLALKLKTPDGEKTAEVRVATAWAGATQIELIEPVSGFIDTYIAGLPEDETDPTPRFHHLAVRRESADDMAREIAELRLPIVFETEGAGIQSAFVDTRAKLGHHLEFVCASPEGWQLLGWPKA